MIGQTVSHYRIVDKLGEGGMGVVYRAEDEVLHRQVALKALPAAATADAERRQRFLQEARAASALNHPNIVTIYDVCESDGTELIVMEYIRGRTLSDSIGRKGLRAGEALKYAIQITDALAAAHKAGLVHRDLKPSNIMVSPEGQVKILDFGLAKLAGGLLAGELEATKTVALGAPRTMDGVLIGTAAYMSPEQAEGKRVDSRSDVFSFGAVLYEMVTGQKAFQGDSTASVLAAILKEQPKPASAVSGQVPRELEKIIGRCLRKDPARRYQAMEDLRLALEEVKEDSESGAPLPVQPAARRRRPRGAEITVAALLLALGALGGWFWSRGFGGEAATPAGPVLTRLTSDAGLASHPALSPDGRLIAYASDRSGEEHLDIWVQQLAGGDPIRITRDPADDYEPSFSADGATIAFRSDRSGGGIYLVSALGGEPRFLTRSGRRPRYSPDGSQIAFWMGSSTPGPPGPGWNRAFVIGAGGGEQRQVAADFEAAFAPEWVDNSHLILAAIRKWSVDGRAPDYWVVPVAGGAATPTGIAPATRKQGLGAMGLSPLTRGDGNRFVLPLAQGDALNLWQVTLSPRTWQIQGPARRLTFGTELEIQPALAGRLMAFAAASETVDIAAVDLEANQGKVSGAPRRLTNTRYARGPSLSADGKKLAYFVARGPQARLYVREIANGKELLLAGPARLVRPVLNADGSRVAYEEMRERRGRTYVMAVEGGVPEQVCDDCGMLLDWSRDGARMLYESGKPPAVHVLDLKSGAKTVVVRHAENALGQAQFSPDGRWIAFQSTQPGGQRGIYVAPFKSQAPESEWIPITGRVHDDERPCWSPDGRLIYFTSTRDGYRCAWAQRVDDAKRPSGAPFAVFHSHSARLLMGRRGGYSLEIAVAPGRLAFTTAESSGNIWMAKFE